MTTGNKVYRCAKCGNVVELLHEGGGELVCCGEPMKLLAENTSDGAKEKHVPAIERIADGFRVTVGAVAHPMEEKHYIQWIELIADGVSYKAYLKPGDKPEAVFKVSATRAVAREYCNLHGLWKAEA
ncbi:MAG TPA: desulfoferrodoxin [Spirochaetia bacterium]|nr:desulfoferrodoxin [Spirochaetales bacterium]HRW25223.1 desulfoferrodoxin [Spirochaetia bacterium]